MKKLVYAGLLLALLGIVFVGCEKTDLSDPTLSDQMENEVSFNEKANGPPGLRIFKVTPHRKEGKTNRQGQDCGCDICAGFCDFEWFPSSVYSGPNDPQDPTLVLDCNASNSTARIYFLTEIDYDEVNSIFYIDEDIEISEDDYALMINNGEYEAIIEMDEITVDGETFTYNSFIDVPFEMIQQ